MGDKNQYNSTKPRLWKREVIHTTNHHPNNENATARKTIQKTETDHTNRITRLSNRSKTALLTDISQAGDETRTPKSIEQKTERCAKNHKSRKTSTAKLQYEKKPIKSILAKTKRIRGNENAKQKWAAETYLTKQMTT